MVETFWKEFKSEFRCSKLYLRHNEEGDFYRLKCCDVPQMVLWCVRLLFTLYCIFSILYSIVFNPYAWPIYLTNWSLFMVTTTFVWSTILSGCNRKKADNDVEQIHLNNQLTIANHDQSMDDIPRHLKAFWIWYNMTFLTSVIIVVMYWPFVFKSSFLETTASGFNAINAHGVTLTLFTIDFFLNLIPIRYLHVVYTLILAIVYILVTIIYNFSTERYVYSILNWREHPGWAAVYSLSPFIFATFMQLILVSVSILKRR